MLYELGSFNIFVIIAVVSVFMSVLLALIKYAAKQQPSTDSNASQLFTASE